MTDLKISEVKVQIVYPAKNTLLGFASCIVNDSFFVGNLAIHKAADGRIRIVYPNKVLPSGQKIELFYPINQTANDAITQAIQSVFHETVVKKVGVQHGEKVN